MSGGDEQAPSFGDPNARPPTPPRISTTAVFASPLLATPKRRTSGQFDEATAGWTPRFAEDYSVFNSTPGNLRGSSVVGAANLLGHSAAPLSPRERPPSSPLSAEGLACEIATHANHFSLAPEKLPPVDAARRLSSSCSDPLNIQHEGTTASEPDDSTPRASRSQQGKRSSGAYQHSVASFSSANVATGKGTRAQNTQTATPPPSSRGGRKLAPRGSEADNMQSHQGFGQPDFSSAQTPQQQQQQAQLNAAFVSGSPEDVFGGGYAMGPATASPVAGNRPFWAGMNMDAGGGMGIDVGLSAAGVETYQTTPTQDPSGRLMNSSDWGRADQMYQQTGMMGQTQREQLSALQQSQGQNVQPNQGVRRERRLAPKTAQMSTPKTSQSFNSYQMSMEDPFSTSPGGVDPGLVFTHLPSPSPLKADTMSLSLSMSMEPSPHRPTSSAPADMPLTMTSMDVEPTVMQTHRPATDIRRTGSAGGRSQRKQLERATAMLSPTKNSAGRLGLSRSFSESARGSKRVVGGGRPALPALAPARPVTVHQPSLPPPTQSQSQGGTRPTGRRSPLKSSRQHRLSSLSSIPENTTNNINNTHQRLRSASRASVKFVIDGNGRARTETVMDEDEPEPESALMPLGGKQVSHRNSWGGFSISRDDDDDDDGGGYPSSSDDEPIIIPSRSASFNFPEPPRYSGSATATTSRPDIFATSGPSQSRLRSNSDRGQSYWSSSFRRSSRMDLDSSMADHMDLDDQTAHQHQQQPPPPRPSTGSSLGDAAAELRKVMQAGSTSTGTSTSGSSKLPSTAQQQQQQQALGSGAGGGSGHRQRFTPGQRSSSSTISEASLPTPSPTQSQNQAQIRCVCNRPEVEVDGAAFLVKCDSCEYLLHGRCVDVPAAQDVPHVYICAFCANTPNMRGGRMRYTGRNNSTGGLSGGGGDDGGMMGPPVSASVIASSPLAHKSFRSFR